MSFHFLLSVNEDEASYYQLVADAAADGSLADIGISSISIKSRPKFEIRGLKNISPNLFVSRVIFFHSKEPPCPNLVLRSYRNFHRRRCRRDPCNFKNNFGETRPENLG